MFGTIASVPIAILILQALSMNAAGQVDQLRSQIAADAAALAAIHEGEEAARTLAQANGAELVAIEWLNDLGTAVTVRIRHDNRESTATAALTE